ncbi:MAG TPA: hypothetical protein VF263_09100 [Longimicrobiaceae bacterium]
MRPIALPLAPAALLLLCASGVRPAAAQERARADSTARAAAPAAPDLSIRARATVRTLRFDVAPEASVRVWACPLADTTRLVDRGGLPRPVQPGVVYRDVRVSVEYAAVLSEALGDLLKPQSCGAAQPSPLPRPEESP